MTFGTMLLFAVSQKSPTLIADCSGASESSGERNCTKKSSSLPDNHDDNNDSVTNLIDVYSPIINEIGFGTILGVCSGYALKKVGKFAAFVVGGVFIVAQVFAGMVGDYPHDLILKF